MATLLYGSGLRLLECCRLRTRDVDFARNQIHVRRGTGDKDRVSMLPVAAKAALQAQCASVREQHGRDLRVGAGWVELPHALAQKYPNAVAISRGSGASRPRGAMWSARPPSAGVITSTKR